MSKGDERLDPLSKNFDPLAALYSNAVELPDPDAPVLDNISKFEVLSTGVEVKPKLVKKEEPEEAPVEPPEEIPSTSQQPLIPTVPENARNVLAFMQSVDGPLGCLRNCMERGARIKVTTRSAKGVRGHLVAQLAAFDKMWNLALEDVTEVWTRKRKKKIPCLHATTGRPEWRVFPPRLTVTPVDKKMERCERYIPKLMMRGEHVVHIQIID